jgi:hypothetical protein
MDNEALNAAIWSKIKKECCPGMWDYHGLVVHRDDQL